MLMTGWVIDGALLSGGKRSCARPLLGVGKMELLEKGGDRLLDQYRIEEAKESYRKVQYLFRMQQSWLQRGMQQ